MKVWYINLLSACGQQSNESFLCVLFVFLSSFHNSVSYFSLSSPSDRPPPVRPPVVAVALLSSAARQVWAAEADAPGGEEEGGGEAERPGGGDERLQQEEGGSRDAVLISATQERQGQEKVRQSVVSPHSSFHNRMLLFTNRSPC